MVQIVLFWCHSNQNKRQNRADMQEIFFSIMPRRIFSESQLSRVRTFLELGLSFWTIKRKLKEDGLAISNGYLSMLKNAQHVINQTTPAAVKRKSSLRRLSPAQLATLKRLICQPHPPTQRDLAKRFGCSQSTVRYAIRKLNMRLVKKPKAHFLSAATVDKRRRRSWPLYLRLRKGRWQNAITSDEAWVYLSDTGRKRSVQYISRSARRSEAEPSIHVANPRGVMVWVAISANGISRPLFIQPGAKINATYYQNNVLQQFFSKDIHKMYPNKNYFFHQDSAPSHKAASTIAWLEQRNIPFIKPDEWMPSSPDASPCDYFLWGYLKAQLNKKSPRSVEGLKTAISATLKKIPQDMLNRALLAWPKRCRQIRYAGGRHIEKYRE